MFIVAGGAGRQEESGTWSLFSFSSELLLLFLVLLRVCGLFFPL